MGLIWSINIVTALQIQFVKEEYPLVSSQNQLHIPLFETTRLSGKKQDFTFCSTGVSFLLPHPAAMFLGH